MTQSPRLNILHEDVANYLYNLHQESDPIVIRLAAYAKSQGFPWLGYEAAQWVEMLTKMIGARRAFEFGSGFGYSAYFLARALGEGGEVHGSEPNLEIFNAHDTLFEGHPYKNRIHMHGEDGFQVLDRLEGMFDVIFIDMDKRRYPDALKVSVDRLNVGGLLLADNVLWSGRVCGPPEPSDTESAALREFNAMAHADPRLKTGILPVGDGLLVGMRIE